MSYSKLKSYAKINLALNVTGRSGKFHKIESIISFIKLYDEIFIKKIKNNQNKIKFKGQFNQNIKSNNTVFKLLNILEKKKILKKKFQIINIEKVSKESNVIIFAKFQFAVSNFAFFSEMFRYAGPEDIAAGANIAGFLKVANAMAVRSIFCYNVFIFSPFSFNISSISNIFGLFFVSKSNYILVQRRD